MKLLTKNIVQVTSYYTPHLGGMENCVREISEALGKKGYSVRVFTSDVGSTLKNNLGKNTVPVSYLKSAEFAHTVIIFSLFFKLLKIPKNSIIHLHVSQALTPETVFLISKLRKIPYIAHIHNDSTSSGSLGFLIKPYKKLILKYVLKNATRVICLSKMQKRMIVNQYGISSKNIVVISNGVGDKFFMKRDIRIKEKTKLLFVGRLAKQKNVPNLVNAVSLMKNKTQLQIVGDGEERMKIEEIIKNNKLKNISLLGKKTGKDLLRIYKNADIFVLPSSNEGMPLVLLEAMAAGLPIVASDIPGVNELLKNRAVLVKKPSVRSFAVALDKTISDRSLQRSLSKRVSLEAKNYSWAAVIKQLEIIYKEAHL